MAEATLREVVEALAPLRRAAGSPEERRAAEWLADRLRAAGARDVRVEDVPYRPGYARELLPLNLAAVAAALAARRGVRRPGVALFAAAVTALVADDVDNRRRLWRRATVPERTTTNVIAECGDPGVGATLVVLAHHDAAPTGVVFDPRPQRWIARRFPEQVARTDTSAPLWWPVLAMPLFTAAGALTGSRLLKRIGLIGSLATTAVGADIARDRIVPGANDNLSGVAALVALAEGEPLPVRVILASCGAEEVLQGGIYAFVDDHLRALDPATTFVLNLDTVGSPELIMLEGEGTLVIEDYRDPAFRDLVAAAAERVSGPLRRGCRASTSTDSVVTSRAGYPTATLCSWEPATKQLSNYHLMTDTPDRLDYGTVARAVAVTAAVADALAARRDQR